MRPPHPSVAAGRDRTSALQPRSGSPGAARRIPALLLGVTLFLGAGCRSTAPAPVSTVVWERGVAALERPLPGDLAALYKLRSGGSGWLRLSVVTRGDAGRMTVAGAFGSALSLVAWDQEGSATVADLRKGCRVPVTDASAVLGLSRLPLPQAIRLLAGRLPISPNGRIVSFGDGAYRIEGEGWSCRVELAAAPWRVVRVEGPAGPESPRWSIELMRHTGSLPGRLEIRTPSGRRLVLELVRLEWNTAAQLPPLPELPLCPGR
ncbi:MAG: hypothetical protein GXP47_08625 [Acidobacteria bacterium]|nr:hypothetical protein [Acidobacteriota bacterium]